MSVKFQFNRTVNEILFWKLNAPLMKSGYVYQQDRATAHTAHGKDCVGNTCWTPTWDFGSKIITPRVTRFEPLRLEFADAQWEKHLQNTPQQNRWAQGFCKPLIAIDEEMLRQVDLDLQQLPTSIRACYCRQRWPHWIIWCLRVLTYRYVTKIV